MNDETYIDSQGVFIWLGATGWRAMKVDKETRSTVGAEFVCLLLGVEFVGTHSLISWH